MMRAWTAYGGPLLRRKRMFTAAGGTSEKCQLTDSCTAAITGLFDHLIGALR